ncbi:MAG: Flp family type IVb pilin [Bacillota bacterium]|nr:Flp family type IVb pilin [Bacillota bacterium]
MKKLVKDFFVQEDGQGMVEYGLIIALIAVVAIVAVRLLGNKTSETFEAATDALGGEAAV